MGKYERIRRLGIKEIENRRSIRKYSAREVESEKLLQLLESARLAPSGSNTQPWRFIIVKSYEKKAALAKADHAQAWMLSAPVFIVCVADLSSRKEDAAGVFVDEHSPDETVKQVIRDTAIAMTYILLEAQAQGLSTCWTAWYRQEEIRPILNLPDDKYVCGIITVGYGEENPNPRPRKDLEALIRYESW